MTRLEEWRALEARAREVRDPGRWRTRIDATILPVVVGLWAHGVPTATSCGGHAELPLTFPRVFVADTGDLDHYHLSERAYWSPRRVAERLAWADANRLHQQRLLGLIGSFYDGRSVPIDVRVQLSPVIDQGFFTLMNAGGEVLRLLPVKKRRARLASYQREMSRFARFLRREFLAQAGARRVR